MPRGRGEIETTSHRSRSRGSGSGSAVLQKANQRPQVEHHEPGLLGRSSFDEILGLDRREKMRGEMLPGNPVVDLSARGLGVLTQSWRAT